MSVTYLIRIPIGFRSNRPIHY